MFFALSKILFLLLQPSSLALILCGTGLALLRSERHRRVGYRLALVGFGWIAFAGFVPVGNALVLPREERVGTQMAKGPEGPVAGSIVTIVSQRVIEIWDSGDGKRQISERHFWRRMAE